jgi:hypothetical protein
MKIATRTLSDLSEMICGGAGGAGFDRKNFPYRSSTYLTEFFRNCDMEYVHDGSTRKWWVLSVLESLNSGVASNPQLPPDGILRVIQELMDAANFSPPLDRNEALSDLNTSLSRDGFQAFFDAAGRCYLRNLGTQVTSANLNLRKRTWTESELKRRAEISEYLDTASEDNFIENVLVPMFSQLGFIRISVSGHVDKSLEYGKDLWMKYQLPTSHFIYFGVQAKKGKLDAAAKSKNENISEVLNQIRMMLASPVWDPETNKKNLLDHVFIACGGEITKQAIAWLSQHLDQESRRHVLFMDREDILDLAAGINLPHPVQDTEANSQDDEDPF